MRWICWRAAEACYEVVREEQVIRASVAYAAWGDEQAALFVLVMEMSFASKEVGCDAGLLDTTLLHSRLRRWCRKLDDIHGSEGAGERWSVSVRGDFVGSCRLTCCPGIDSQVRTSSGPRTTLSHRYLHAIPDYWSPRGWWCCTDLLLFSTHEFRDRRESAETVTTAERSW